MNAALEELTGKTSLELRGQALNSVFYQSQSNIDLSEKLIKKISSGILLDCEIEIVNAAGESVPMSITSKAHL
ncbi:MAG: PAS domain-containing protein [Gammaproteobacteria bacterium]|nr:PAS domain-containing protein [Gammaproteobacteria bacterium]